jgi:hypothetical protein
LTPSLHEGLVRLGAWLPFTPAAGMLAYFTHVTVSDSTARRQTEAAGAAYVAVQAAELAHLERALPEPPLGPAVQQVTVDGVFVPLVGGHWAEVKTLTIGTVQPPVWSERDHDWQVHTTDLSYYARLADYETFSWGATVETQRRGTATAGTVCAVADGADWCQSFVDLHRPDAVRILDFPHAVGYLTRAAQAIWGTGSDAATRWTSAQARALLEDGPDPVLAALRELDPAGTVEAVTTALGYLEPRVQQLQYPAFRAAGYPIGSGCGESANKLVVEARLKGSGMHWQRQQVDAMVALRTIACSDHWAEAWPQIQAQLQRQGRHTAQARRRLRQAALAPVSRPTDDEPSDEPTETWAATALPPPADADADADAAGGATPTTRQRPAADHPWRRQRIGRSLPFPQRAEL